MSESKHTQIPWNVDLLDLTAEEIAEMSDEERRAHWSDVRVFGPGPEYRMVADPIWPGSNWESAIDTMLANADLIVRAVNAHEALVEALDTLYGCIHVDDHGQPHRCATAGRLQKAMLDARAALAKAKGE